MNPIPTDKIGEAVVNRREALGMSGGELSRRSGIDRALISRWENGKWADMKISTLQKLADALDWTPVELLRHARDLTE